METVLLFVDFANINASAEKSGRHIDYGHLLNYLTANRRLLDAYCYVPINPRNLTGRDRIIDDLWTEGYLVRKKVGNIAGESYKCDFDVEIAMDMVRAAIDVQPDIVVLASGDCDFVPVIMELRRRGIRTEVAGFLDTSSREVILKSSGFVDLDAFLQEDIEVEYAETNQQ